MLPLVDTPLSMMFFLVVGHALADYPLQGEFLASAKSRHTEVGRMIWPAALGAHALIHAGFVALITGSVALGIAEMLVHGLTDWLKCERRIGFATDQAIHVLAKVAWCAIVFITAHPIA